MAIAWFICPYTRQGTRIPPIRHCDILNYKNEIKNVNGKFSYGEILGNYALVKVRASEDILNVIDSNQNFVRLPNLPLNNSLSVLTSAQRNIFINHVLNMGYSLQEIETALGNLSAVTLGDLMRFILSRRLKPRFDRVNNQIILDGPVQTCRLLRDIDNEVQ